MQAQMLNAATMISYQVEQGYVVTASHVQLQQLQNKKIWLLLHFCLLNLMQGASGHLLA